MAGQYLPYREQTPWDISTDFHTHDCSSTTSRKGHGYVWTCILRRGTSSLTCLETCTAFRATSRILTYSEGPSRLAWSSVRLDAHFSLEGDRFVFRSDAGLGVENIWVMAWRGCREMDVRPTTALPHNRLKREGRLEGTTTACLVVPLSDMS